MDRISEATKMVEAFIGAGAHVFDRDHGKEGGLRRWLEIGAGGDEIRRGMVGEAGGLALYYYRQAATPSIPGAGHQCHWTAGWVATEGCDRSAELVGVCPLEYRQSCYRQD